MKRYISKPTNLGVPNVAHQFDTEGTFNESGDKLMSWRNNGIEKASLDKDGNLTVTSVVGGGGAVTSVNGQTGVVVLGANEINSMPFFVVLPVDGGAGIAAAMASANGVGGGVVQLLEGTYEVTSEISCDGFSNVELRGIGSGTILNVNNVSDIIGIRMSATQVSTACDNEAISNITAEDTSITLTTAANAGDWEIGDMVTIVGTDVNSLPEILINEVSIAGNPGTGVVGLKWKIAKTMTACTASCSTGNRRNTIRDIKFTIAGSVMDTCAITINGGRNNRIVGCFFEASNDASAGCIQLNPFNNSHGYLNTISNSVFEDDLTTSVAFRRQSNSIIDNCLFENSCTAGSASSLDINTSNRDCYIRYNQFTRSGADQIKIATDTSRRIFVKNNDFFNAASNAIHVTQNEVVIENNNFDRSLAAAILSDIAGSGKKITVRGNRIQNCAGGIWLQGTGAANNKIIDNEILWSSQDAIVLKGDNSQCLNNMLFNFASYGIYVTGNKSQISNNTLDTRANNVFGINLDSTAAYNIVSNNSILNGTNRGIVLADTADFNTVIGNMLEGEELIPGTGANNVFIGNLE